MEWLKVLNRVRSDLTYYLDAHQNRHNRILHYFAFLSAFIAWIYLFIDIKVTIVLAILHYLFSWIDHFYFEGNKPAAFRYPFIGIYAGFTFGSLKHFHSGNAPEGSTDRCLDCAVEATCPYSAMKFYLSEEFKGWARHFTPELTREKIVKGLRETDYGRCVYRSDNNVVDHQVVNMEFEGGATAMFSMCGFTFEQERRIQVMGTRGELRGYSGQESLTSAAASVRSHLMAFAAEESRLNGGKSIDLAEYAESLMAKS